MEVPGVTFMDMYLSDQVSSDRIGEWVNAWLEHEYNQRITPTRSLRSYLGFTEQEYLLWVQDPSGNLPGILLGRKPTSFEEDEIPTLPGFRWSDLGGRYD